MIRIEFLKDFRSFKKGAVYEFDTSKAIIIVGDNGCGKSTLMNLLYCYFLRLINTDDKKISDELPLIHYKMVFGDPKTHARYIYHNVFDIVKITYPDNFYFFKYSTFDYNIATADMNDPRMPAELIAKQVYLNSMSRGEIEFENLTDFIEDFKKIRDKSHENWVIFDEPDNSLSIRHSRIMPYYFNYNTPGKILILHHPYMISPAEKVYYLKKRYDSDGSTKNIDMITCTGDEFLKDIIDSSQSIIDEMLGKS